MERRGTGLWGKCVLVTLPCLTLRPHGLQPARLLCPRDCLGKNTGMGSLSLLQGIFQTQGSNPGLPHCRWILYFLSHQKRYAPKLPGEPTGV